MAHLSSAEGQTARFTAGLNVFLCLATAFQTAQGNGRGGRMGYFYWLAFEPVGKYRK